MLKVVLDTNVLVSSIFWGGASYKIVKLASKRKIQVYTSNPIIRELIRVLKSKVKYNLPETKIQEIVEVTRLYSMVVYPREHVNVVHDRKDNKFLECALAAGADYLASGDKHLLDLKEFRGIKIVSPQELLRIMRE